MIIELSKGMTTIIDDMDVWVIEGNKWVVSGTVKGRFYAVRGKGKDRVYLHRVLMNAPKGTQVDHINGDTLYNSRSNLRLCTSQENSQNRKKRKGSSRYKGVYFDKRLKKWLSQIMLNGKKIHLGCFSNEIAAAKEYDINAERYFGSFARKNFK